MLLDFRVIVLSGISLCGNSSYFRGLKRLYRDCYLSVASFSYIRSAKSGNTPSLFHQPAIVSSFMLDRMLYIEKSTMMMP